MNLFTASQTYYWVEQTMYVMPDANVLLWIYNRGHCTDIQANETYDYFTPQTSTRYCRPSR